MSLIFDGKIIDFYMKTLKFFKIGTNELLIFLMRNF
jgi:hypothetical protein